MRGVLGVLGAAVAGSAWAGPTMAITTSGACRDAELASDVKLLSSALRSRVGDALVGPEQISAKLGAEATAGADELKRQLDSAKTLLFQGDGAKAEKALTEVLAQAERLPPDASSWSIQTNALLFLSLIEREHGKADAADEAFRRVLRVDPAVQLDSDYFSPALHKRFDHLRAELKQARHVSFAVRSTPSGADVYVDGKKLGQTPATISLPAGTYPVVIARGDAVSLTHPVSVRDDATLHVDLQFEGAIRGRQLPCIDDGGDERTRLANAVKLAAVIGVDRVVVARLERPAAGPGWFAASMVHAPTAQRIREGGLKVEELGKPPDGLDELADFLVTGQPSQKVLTELPKPEAAVTSPVATLAPPSATTVSEAPAPERTWKSTAGLVLAAGGVAVGVGGALLAVDGSHQWSSFNSYYANGAPGPGQIPAAQGAQSRAVTDTALGWTGVGVGAAALGVGAFLWWTDRPAGSGGGWAMAPIPGGVSFTGWFP